MIIPIEPNDPFEANPQGIDFQKEIKNWNNKLKDQKIRTLSSDYQNETGYIWNSDLDRQGKNVYDSGEVHNLNEEYERDAVRRDMKKKALVRVTTGKQVFWSNFEGK